MSIISQLSTGAIQAIWNGQQPQNPILQIIDCRKVANKTEAANSVDRYRLIISDSVHYQQAMVATQLNGLLASNTIMNRCVVKLTEYLCNPVQGKKIIILLGLEVLSSPLSQTIGSPVSIDQPATSPSNTPSPPQQGNPSTSPPVQSPNIPNSRTSIPPSSAPPQQSNYIPQQQTSNPMQQMRMNQPAVQPNPGYQQPMAQAPSGAPVQPQRQVPQQHQPMGQPPAQPRQTPQQTWQPPSNPQMNSPPPQVQQYATPNHLHPQGYANGHAHGAPPASPDHINPINTLNPYKHKWTIKARVTSKSDIKQWNNERGSGQLASVDLMDKDGGEIRATMFGDTVTRLHPVFEVGKIFMISKGSIKSANKKFNTLNNEWELSFTNETMVQQCLDASFPRIQCQYIPLAEIMNRKKDNSVDLLAVVLETTDATKFMSKGGKEVGKRVVKIADSAHSIELTLWGPQADNPGWEKFEHPVISVRGATVSEFNNRTLSCLRSSMIEVNPDIPEATNLKNWFESQGGRVTVTPLSFNPKKKDSSQDTPLEVKTFAQIKMEQIGISEQQSCIAKGMITIMKRESGTTFPWYYACPEKSCGGKKVTHDQLSGTFNCAKCSNSVTTPDVRYILNFCASDHTGNAWVTCFNEVGHALLQKTAPEMAYYKDADPALYEMTWAESTFQQYMFTIKATPDNYQGEPRARLSVVEARPINFVNESKSLINSIYQYGAM